MKTAIKSLIASSLTAILLSSTLLITNVNAAEKVNKVIAANVPTKRIIIRGNIEVMLVQKNNEKIFYADDNMGRATAIKDGDALRITATGKDLTKIVVHVTDIFRIDASDDVVIKTEGKLTTKYLQVFLQRNAKADLNTSSEGLYTVIKDHSELKLSGSTDRHTLIMGTTQKLTIEKFAALKTNISSTEIGAIEKEVAFIK